MPNYRPVRCVETGEEFGSIKEASESLGLSPNAVGVVLQGHALTAGGYHWEYATPEGISKPRRKLPRRRSGHVGPFETVEEVQKEAARRSRETGRHIRYAHIQIEETLQLYGGWKLHRHNKNEEKKRTKEEKK